MIQVMPFCGRWLFQPVWRVSTSAYGSYIINWVAARELKLSYQNGYIS